MIWIFWFRQIKSWHLWTNLIHGKVEWKGIILRLLWVWVIVLKGVAEDIADYLTALGNEFQRLFSEYFPENAQTRLIKNPFWCQFGSFEEALQEQYLHIYHDSLGKDEYKAVEMERFGLSASVLYQKMGSNALEVLMPFSENYLCDVRLTSSAKVKRKLPNLLNFQPYIYKFRFIF